MLARSARAVRHTIRPPPCYAVTGSHTLARCFASAVPPPPSEGSEQQQQQEEQPAEERDGGAQFMSDDPSFSRDSRVQQESLSEASGTFTRTSSTGGAAGGIGRHNILPPRQRGASSAGTRADDPASRNLVSMVNQINITSEVSSTVGHRAGEDTNSKRIRPRKGGRPIQQTDIVEQRGKLTPMQIHRLLASTTVQQPGAQPDYTAEEAAKHFGIDAATAKLVRTHLSLPFVLPGAERGWWLGTPGVPVALQIERALGQADTEKPLRFMGDHIRIKRDK